jgi:hypothetical protein
MRLNDMVKRNRCNRCRIPASPIFLCASHIGGSWAARRETGRWRWCLRQTEKTSNAIMGHHAPVTFREPKQKHRGCIGPYIPY